MPPDTIISTPSCPVPPSVRQENLPRVESQFKVWVSASQSPRVPPATLGSLKAEILAVPETSKSEVTEARPLIRVLSVIASFKVMRLSSATVKTAVPASRTTKSPVPPRLMLKLPAAAVMLAVPVNSMKSNWVEAALKFHLPVMTSSKARLAGPLVQSKLMVEVPLEDEILNSAKSKERDETLAKALPDSLTPIRPPVEPEPVLSEAQPH